MRTYLNAAGVLDLGARFPLQLGRARLRTNHDDVRLRTNHDDVRLRTNQDTRSRARISYHGKGEPRPDIHPRRQFHPL